MISTEMMKLVEMVAERWLANRSRDINIILEAVAKDVAPIIAAEVKARIELLATKGDIEHERDLLKGAAERAASLLREVIHQADYLIQPKMVSALRQLEEVVGGQEDGQ